MFKKMLLAFAGLGAAGVFTVFLLTIPLHRRLPKQSHVSLYASKLIMRQVPAIE